MKIRNYRFTPEDVDCRYCVKYLHGRCRAGICPWINERVEAGTVDYREAVDETFLEYLPLRRRAKLVSATASNRFWRDDAHRERFAMAQAISAGTNGAILRLTMRRCFCSHQTGSFSSAVQTVLLETESTSVLQLCAVFPRTIMCCSKPQKACIWIRQRSAWTSLPILNLSALSRSGWLSTPC